MIINPKKLKIRRPDDWHLHLRDDRILRTVLPYSSKVFARIIVMPNLEDPITTVDKAIAYKNRILAALPLEHKCIPLMTCYLTNKMSIGSSINELIKGFEGVKENKNVFTAAKLYPANSTTNSNQGVTDITALYPLFETMQEIGMPLLLHGEVTNTEVDIFDREVRFIDDILEPIRNAYPSLKIVFEHITTNDAVDYVLNGGDYIAATITPQHLMFNRNDMLVDGIHPHLYCLPILKRSRHQKALRSAIASGSNRFFLGTDSAPHTKDRKESACGCAGIFNAPIALPIYTQIFEELDALKHLESFCSLNGPHFYGLDPNEEIITLVKISSSIQPMEINIGETSIIPFLAGGNTDWSINNN